MSDTMQSRSVLLSHPNSRILWSILGVMAVFATGTAPAFAAVQTLGQATRSVYDDFLPAQNFLSSIVFLLGIWYVIKGIASLRATGEGGNNAPSLSHSLYKLGGGAALIALPFIISVLIRTATDGSLGGQSISLDGPVTKTFAGPGLDEAMGRFVTDIFKPFIGRALPYFCYLAGVILLVRGLQRLINADDRGGAKAPGGFGTWTIFGVAAGLMSMGYFMNALQGSIFGVTKLYANVMLCDQSPLSVRAQDVLWGVFQFLRIVGYIAVVRGLFMLKGFADGANGASLLGASTFIIAGAMLANVYFFIWTVQNTFVSDSGAFVFSNPGGGSGGCS